MVTMSLPPTPGGRRHDNRLQRRVFEAVRNGDIATIDGLIDEHGSDLVLSLTMSGQTVLLAAVDSCQEDMLRFLFEEEGATDHIDNLHWNGDTLLHQAVREGPNMADIVRVLLESGANQTIRDRNQMCALDKAVDLDLPDIVKVLITHGNSPERTAQLANTYLSVAKQRKMNEMVAALLDLLEHFEEEDPEFDQYNAIISNDHRKFNELFNQHVDPFCVRFGQREMSALHAAARQTDIRVLAMLLARVDRMGRVDALDNHGQSPLHYAVAKNNEINIDWLLFAGADPDIEDKDKKLPEHLTSSCRVKKMFDSCWGEIPDAIILMHGDWHQSLPRTLCTLFRSSQQPPDHIIPPVLLFRCVTKDVEEEEKTSFEQSTFETEETCLELYEYRCSQPSVLGMEVDVGDYGYNYSGASFFFKCCDDEGKLVETVQLTVNDAKEGSCEVEVLKSGMLVLMVGRNHMIASAPVGPDQCVIKPDHLQGFELQVPQDAFHCDQLLLIKAEDPPRLLQPDPGEGEHKEISPLSSDSDVLAIKSISCFYTILNTAQEKPHKSLRLKIPMETKPNNKVVTLLMRHSETGHGLIDNSGARNGAVTASDVNVKNKRKSQNENEDENHHSYDKKDDEKDEGESDTDDCRGAVGGATASDVLTSSTATSTSHENEAVWKVTDDAIVNSNQTAVSASVRDVGVVVAAEVQADVTEEQIIRAIQKVYTRHSKRDILIFSMAKPYPGQRVEVMVCCVSEENYETTKQNLQQEAYQLLRQPIVAYAFNREIFSLQLKGNFTDIYMDSEPVLEYQVGGRLNHTTFVLELCPKDAEAVGAISVTRRTSDNSQFPTVGLLQLELTHFFRQRFPAPRPGQGARMEEVVLALSEHLSTDLMRVYCHALGLTKDVMKTVCRPQPGKSLSPTERNFQMLSKTRSQFRSEPAFRKHLKEVLKQHKEKEALALIDDILKKGKSK